MRTLLPLLFLIVPGLAHAAPRPGLLALERTEAGQAHFAGQPRWRSFQQRHGPWQAVFDERSGAPLRAWGPGIEVGPEPVEGVLALLAREQDLLGSVDVSRLEPAALEWIDGVGYLLFEQRHCGHPVRGAEVDGRLRGERLVALGFDLRSLENPCPEEAPLPSAAVGAAVGRVPGSAHLEWIRVGASDRLAWRFEVRRPGVWEHRWYDAFDGDAVDRVSLLRHVEGELWLEREPRTVGAARELAPAAEVTLRRGEEEVITGPDGSFDVEPGAWEAWLQGPRVRVDSLDEEPFTASITVEEEGASWVLTTDEPDAGRRDRLQAQLDAFSHTVDVIADVQRADPDFAWGTETVQVNVNLDDTCNAYFDGESINFFRPGGGCQNTARIADVVYHEYGHGQHLWTIVTGSFDAALSEGVSDYRAATLTDDPVLAPGFLANGQWLREFDSDRRWPDDVSASPHNTGLIIAGALWDLRTLFIDLYGYEEGRLRADRAHVAVMAGADDIPGSWLEVLVWDDDDADPSNGTPHICELLSAFSRHGLAPDPYRHVQPEDGVTLALTAELGTTPCRGAELAATLHWWPEGAPEQEQAVSLAHSGPGLAADLPTEAALRYRFELRDELGLLQALPAEGAESSYRRVESGEVVFHEGFESGSAGWRHGGAGSDWEFGSPAGLVGDPARAWEGASVAGTDLGGAGGNGAYAANAASWLESPPIDVSLAGERSLRLRFRRWLALEDARFDRARVLVNDEVVWTPEPGAPHLDRFWFQEDIALPAGLEQVTIRFELDSDGGVQAGGWNLDDVEIVALDPVQVRARSTAGCSHSAGAPGGSEPPGPRRTQRRAVGWFLVLMMLCWRRR